MGNTFCIGGSWAGHYITTHLSRDGEVLRLSKRTPATTTLRAPDAMIPDYKIDIEYYHIHTLHSNSTILYFAIQAGEEDSMLEGVQVLMDFYHKHVDGLSEESRP